MAKLPNSGTLGRNQRKQQPNHPDMAGSLSVQCPHCQALTDYWLNGWLKESQQGGSFISVSVRVKQPRGEQRKPATQATADILGALGLGVQPPARGSSGPAKPEPDDDIPF